MIEQKNKNALLTIFRDSLGRDWKTAIEKGLRELSMGMEVKASSVSCWPIVKSVPVRKDGLCYADGHQMFREWIAKDNDCIAIRPRRMYFEANSLKPTTTKESILFSQVRPPTLPTPHVRLSSCLGLARSLSAVMEGFAADPVPSKAVRYSLQTKTTLEFGKGMISQTGIARGIMLCKNGFQSVPENFVVVICGEQDDHSVIQKYAAQIADSMRRSHCGGKSKVTKWADIKSRLQKPQPVTPGVAFLLGIHSRIGHPLTPEAQTLLDELESRALAYRMFSLENEALNWSAFDQLGSLIQAAGGIPYSVNLPWPEHCAPPFLLGIDVGHPLDKEESWVAMSVLTHRGVLVASWRRRQARNETIRPQVLRQGLSWAREVIMEQPDAGTPGVLVFRDGRLPPGEPINVYRNILNMPLSLIEVDKRRNPEAFLSGDTLDPADAGTEIILEGERTRFIVPIKPRLRNDLAKTLKLYFRREWDGLKLGFDAASEIAIGLAYAPGLGLQPHTLSAPLYWADGVAAIGNTNHQFAGQRINTGAEP